MQPDRLIARSLIPQSILVGLYVMTTALLFANHRQPFTLDRIIMTVMMAGTLYALIFAAGHRLAGRAGMVRPNVSIILGAISATLAFAIVVESQLMVAAWHKGKLVVTLLRPAMIGTLTGYLYARAARHLAATSDDDPDSLAVFHPGSLPTGEAVVQTTTAAYYDGPMQVRLSAPLIAIAALCGACVQFACVLATLLLNSVIAIGIPIGMLGTSIMGSVPGGIPELTGLLVISLPHLVTVSVAAALLQRLGWISRTVWVACGIGGPILVGIFLAITAVGPVAVLIGLSLSLPSAVSLYAYRALAGLEPRDLPEDITVRDERTLIGKNHVRRRMHRVVR